MIPYLQPRRLIFMGMETFPYPHPILYLDKLDITSKM